MTNDIPYKITMNEESPFEFSTFQGQYVIVVRQFLPDEKFSAISQTNCRCVDGRQFLLVREFTVAKTENYFLRVPF